MSTRNCLVVVKPAVKESDLHNYDIGVAGVYLVNGIEAGLTDEHICETALESFHDSQGIKVLDDFHIRVVDVDRKIELVGASLPIESLEVLHCEKLGDDIPDWVNHILETPELISDRSAYDSFEP